MSRKGTVSYLRQMRTGLLRKASLPEDALPGSLSMSRLRCGKENCHCKKDEKHRHTVWSLTFMVEGKKRVQHIPADLVEYVKERVSEGKKFKEALNQIFVANLDLLILGRKERKADQ